jgi:hypothetical protein
MFTRIDFSKQISFSLYFLTGDGQFFEIFEPGDELFTFFVQVGGKPLVFLSFGFLDYGNSQRVEE